MTNVHLLADLHRAQQRGDRSVDVPTVDLAQLLARLEQLEARQAVAVSSPVGWADGGKLEAMRRGERKYLTVALYKSDKFDTHVGVMIDERV